MLKELSCDAFIVEDQINLYYMTGLFLSSGMLLVYPEGAHLIVDARYYELCKKESPFPIILREDKPPMTTFLAGSDLPKITTVGFSRENMTYGTFLKLQKELETFGLALKAVENPIVKLRTIKNQDEIAILSKTAALGSEGFDYLCSLLREGITEVELAVELEIFWKRKGSKTIAFDPIIAFGANSSMPHYRVGNHRLQYGDAVLIDIGVNYENYHSDMCRVVFFGEPDPKIKAIYSIVKSAQETALQKCFPGTRIGDLDASARDYIEKEGYGENFTHSLGHGVGLEIHEAPMIRNQPPYQDVILEPGMVLTVEPGIYLPGIGGVRIEDTVVITEEGHQNLTNRSKDLKVLGLKNNLTKTVEA